LDPYVFVGGGETKQRSGVFLPLFYREGETPKRMEAESAARVPCFRLEKSSQERGPMRTRGRGGGDCVISKCFKSKEVRRIGGKGGIPTVMKSNSSDQVCIERNDRGVLGQSSR